MDKIKYLHHFVVGKNNKTEKYINIDQNLFEEFFKFVITLLFYFLIAYIFNRVFIFIFRNMLKLQKWKHRKKIEESLVVYAEVMSNSYNDIARDFSTIDYDFEVKKNVKYINFNFGEKNRNNKDFIDSLSDEDREMRNRNIKIWDSQKSLMKNMWKKLFHYIKQRKEFGRKKFHHHGVEWFEPKDNKSFLYFLRGNAINLVGSSISLSICFFGIKEAFCQFEDLSFFNQNTSYFITAITFFKISDYIISYIHYFSIFSGDIVYRGNIIGLSSDYYNKNFVNPKDLVGCILDVKPTYVIMLVRKNTISDFKDDKSLIYGDNESLLRNPYILTKYNSFFDEMHIPMGIFMSSIRSFPKRWKPVFHYERK